MKPVAFRSGLALWYSRDDGGYYWQDENGWGDNTSAVYETEEIAHKALNNAMIRKGKLFAKTPQYKGTQQ